MRLMMTLTITCLFVFCLAGLAWEQPVRAVRLVEQPNHSSTVRARAIVRDFDHRTQIRRCIPY